MQQEAPLIGGAGVGVGVPFLLRETADMQNCAPNFLFELEGAQGFATASVAYGLGAGALTGALWLGGVGPEAVQDFSKAHTLTAIPAGLLSGLAPRAGCGLRLGPAPE